MVKRKYSDIWFDKNRPVQTACFIRANYRCEVCGMRFSKRGKSLFAVRKDGKRMILTCHHIDNDGYNNNPDNLLACCQRCHLQIEGKWIPGDILPKHWLPVPRWIVERKLSYELPPDVAIPVQTYPMFSKEDFVNERTGS